MAYLRLMRPHQWIKNVFVLAGVVFGRKLHEPEAVLTALLGFLAVSLISSTVYIINDIRDREEDRQHPRKRTRPLASGAARVPVAAALAVVLGLAGLVGSFLLGPAFFLVVLGYLIMQSAYTLRLKRVVLLDVILIAVGFVLRAVAGAVLVHVEISIWLVLCTFTLCLFMGFSKRACELKVLSAVGGGQAGNHRITLTRYTPDLLNHMTTVSAGIAIISFMLYVTDDVTIAKFGTNYLAYTLPLVVYAIFRFALLVEEGRVDGPTDVLLRDRPFQIALILWAGAALLIIYQGPAIQAALAPPPPVGG